MNGCMERNHLYSLAIFVLIFTVFPFLLEKNSYWITIFIFVGIYSLVALGLCLLMGYAGQISLGQGAFFGLGAYTSGLLTTQMNWNPWFALLIALIGTSLIALVIGIPVLRLSGHYLAMATLAMGEIIGIAFMAEVDLTGGPSGFGSIPRLAIFGFVLKKDLAFYFFIWSVVAVVLGMALNLTQSRVGRALRSIHGGEMAANALGVNTASYKVQIFVLSAALASLSGSLYAHYVTFVSPTACDLKLSVFLMVMVAVGGMHSLWGALLGTMFLTVLPEFLAVFKDFDVLAYGLILMAIMIFIPDGLFGFLKSLAGRFRYRMGKV